MTKEEFATMLDAELEKLQEEYKINSHRYEFMKKFHNGSIDYNNSLFQKQITKKKLESLKKVITLPLYARVQAMSDVELEAEKKARVEEAELNIKAKEEEIKQAEEKLSHLNDERVQLIDKYEEDGYAKGTWSDTLYYREQELCSEIHSYHFDIIPKLEKELEELRKKPEEIKLMTNQDIKQQLLSKVKISNSLGENAKMFENSDVFRDFTSPLEPEKLEQMESLLNEYQDLCNEQKTLGVDIGLPYEIPNFLKNRLSSASGPFNEDGLEQLIEIVEKGEKVFESSKVIFDNKYIEQKLLPLLDRKHNVTSDDIAFLQQFSDKIPESKFDYWKSLMGQRDALSNKIFKTLSTKRKIKDLDGKLNLEISKMQESLVYWHKSEFYALYGGNLDFTNEDYLRASLEEGKKTAEISQSKISEYKERLKQAAVEFKQKNKPYEDKKLEIVQKVKELSGAKYEANDVNYNSSSKLTDAYVDAYERATIDRVRQEAQKEADIREAQLRGITVEQLLQMRNGKVQNSFNEYEEEETFHRSGR